MSEKNQREWRRVKDWACRHVGIDRIEHSGAYPSAFYSKGAMIGQKCPMTGMRYRIPTKGHYAQINKPRCYVLWQGETLDKVIETFAFLKMTLDNVDYVLLFGSKR
jgi:hypothetical protein